MGGTTGKKNISQTRLSKAFTKGIFAHLCPCLTCSCWTATRSCTRTSPWSYQSAGSRRWRRRSTRRSTRTRIRTRLARGRRTSSWATRRVRTIALKIQMMDRWIINPLREIQTTCSRYTQDIRYRLHYSVLDTSSKSNKSSKEANN